MKRYMTLVASILSISIQSIFAILLVFILKDVGSEISNINKTGMYIFLGVLLGCVLCTIVLDGFSLSLWKKNHEKFDKYDGVINASIAFNFISIAGAVVLMVFSLSLLITMLSLFVILVSLTCAVLFIVDIALEKSRNKQVLAEKAQIEVNNQSVLSNFESKLLILLDMKTRGLISEEECAQLRKKYLEEEKPKPNVKPKSELEIKIDKIQNMFDRGLIDEDDFKKLKTCYIKESIR